MFDRMKSALHKIAGLDPAAADCASVSLEAVSAAVPTPQGDVGGVAILEDGHYHIYVFDMHRDADTRTAVTSHASDAWFDWNRAAEMMQLISRVSKRKLDNPWK